MIRKKSTKITRLSYSSEDSNFDAQNAAATARSELARFATPDKPLTMLVSQNEKQHELILPAEAVELMLAMLEALASEKSVSIVASDKEMTTQQVAHILCVSRPFVTQLIDSGQLRHRMVGTHRRVRFDDVMAYKRDIDEKRDDTLDELTSLSQELGLYD